MKDLTISCIGSMCRNMQKMDRFSGKVAGLFVNSLHSPTFREPVNQGEVVNHKQETHFLL